MPIRRNRQYNDPALGAAFDNIAGLFAPPDASDAYAIARARETNDKNSRFVSTFDALKSGEIDRNAADPLLTALGVYNPSQSYYAVDEGNDVLRRGQDVTAQTSITNNTADNARAIITNQADNKAGIQKQTIASLLQDIGPNATRIIPPRIADAFNVDDTQRGSVVLNKDQTFFEPDGTVKTGVLSPKTETEVKGAILERQPAAVQDSLARSSINVEKTLDANGQPVYSDRFDAIGKPAAPTSGQNIDVVNYKTQDGRVGSAKVMPDGRLLDEQNNPLPAGTITGKITSPTTESFGKTTEVEGKNAMFGARAAPASAALDAALAPDPITGQAGYSVDGLQADADFEAAFGITSGLPNAVNRHVVSPAGRAFYNQAENFMMSVLRPDTGAAFGKDEFRSYARVFIPMPGDGPEIIQAKSEARQLALAALQGTSGEAGLKVAKAMADKGLPIPAEFEKVLKEKYPNLDFSVVAPDTSTPTPDGQPAPVAAPPLTPGDTPDDVPVAPAAPARSPVPNLASQNGVTQEEWDDMTPQEKAVWQ